MQPTTNTIAKTPADIFYRKYETIREILFSAMSFAYEEGIKTGKDGQPRGMVKLLEFYQQLENQIDAYIATQKAIVAADQLRGEDKEKERVIFERPTQLGIERILLKQMGERGDNEGAIECLQRIIQERDVLLREAIKVKVFNR